MKPSPNEYDSYYANYIARVKNDDLLSALHQSTDTSAQFWSSIPAEKGTYRYGQGKWSVKEILGHIIDTERIFCYRAVAFARGETTALTGYDHNAYVDRSNADSRNLEEMIEELAAVRTSTFTLFKSFNEDLLKTIGNANGNDMSVRAAGFVIVGHEMHHSEVIRERYL